MLLNELFITELATGDISAQQEARRIAAAFGKWLSPRNEETPLREIRGVRRYELERDKELHPVYVVNAGHYLTGEPYGDLWIGFVGPNWSSGASVAPVPFGDHDMRYFITIRIGDPRFAEDIDLLFGISWDVLIHELTHYLDIKRSKGNSVKGDDPDRIKYYNSPLEFNAYFQQGLYHLFNEIKTLKPNTLAHYMSSFELFRAWSRISFHGAYRRAMSPETQRRFDKRLYALYVHLQDVYREKGRISLDDATPLLQD
jgi:hypothetical protein